MHAFIVAVYVCARVNYECNSSINIESKFLRKIVNCFNHNFTFRAKSINNLLARLKSWHSKSVSVEQN
jgi:hypothetical protein